MEDDDYFDADKDEGPNKAMIELRRVITMLREANRKNTEATRSNVINNL